ARRCRGQHDARERTLSSLRGSMELGVAPRKEIQRALPRFSGSELLRRGLHEVARGAEQGTAGAATERELGAAYRVDDDAGRVRGIPDFKLQFGIERHTAERRALNPDIGPFAISEPRHVIARADMDVSVWQRHVQLTGHGLRFR